VENIRAMPPCRRYCYIVGAATLCLGAVTLSADAFCGAPLAMSLINSWK